MPPTKHRKLLIRSGGAGGFACLPEFRRILLPALAKATRRQRLSILDAWVQSIPVTRDEDEEKSAAVRIWNRRRQWVRICLILLSMAIVAVAGRKGGVGKSTIVGNLAAEFAAMGRRVAVLDADPQHSLVAWAEQGEGMLASCVEKATGGADTLRSRARKAEKDADIVLIDTPPGMPEVAYQAALAADLLLLPCGPSPLDLFALKEALSLGLQRARNGDRRSRAYGSCLRRSS